MSIIFRAVTRRIEKNEAASSERAEPDLKLLRHLSRTQTVEEIKQVPSQSLAPGIEDALRQFIQAQKVRTAP